MTRHLFSLVPLTMMMACATSIPKKPLGLTVDHIVLSEARDCAEIAVNLRGGKTSGYVLGQPVFPVVSLVSTHPPQNHLRLSYASPEYTGVVFGGLQLTLVEVSSRHGITVVISVPLPLVPRVREESAPPGFLVKEPTRTSMPLYIRVAFGWVSQDEVQEADRRSRTIDRGVALLLQEIVETEDVLIGPTLPTSPRVACSLEPGGGFVRAISTTRLAR